MGGLVEGSMKVNKHIYKVYTCLEQHGSIIIPSMAEMFHSSAVQYGSPRLHVAIELLK